MFGKKKEVVEYDGLPVLLSKREAFDRFTGRITSRFLAYRVGDEWKGLVGYEQFREELDLVNKKLNLILDHLNLIYQPETEKKEPAQLVPKTVVSERSFKDYAELLGIDLEDMIDAVVGEQPKKKRGRPKKK